MKFSFAIILLLCSLFLISSCKKSNKIQKTSEFKPICEEGSLTCEKGKSSACGTEPGSGEVTAYCIDKNDIILAKTKCKVEGEEDINFSAQCITGAEQRWREEEKQPKAIEKNVEFRVVCKDGRLRCTMGGTPACGVRSGEVTMQSYCIDVNDTYLGRVECLGVSIPPVCERIIE